MTAEAGARQRIDKWLFFARVVKSRSLAAKLAVGGKVRLNRDKIEQAAHQVKVGDVLTITLDRRILVYKIVAPGERRGPAPEAQLLYEDLSPPPASATAMAAEVVTPQRESGAGRPTKKARRETDRLRGN
ncbi:RNA-binding S4 domain-containing protein [Brucella tritici]|uniref:RNA-binding S4 domain-containing protein n=1 Tax=Brucella tritici TaxID=94626 RepID=A0A7X6FQZ7_9HYPH|nr:RNA-binding S4 domain-containing protein [Brucella tritici]KAB2665731.1 RNA-binding S4 domain-containing protein [Brucella tritici]NKW09069.1 RNA-binding S4 domain-containing protein [Brucella tritici]